VLFTLERSQNANQVVYELKPSVAAGAPYLIHPYWRMLAQDGHTEELTGMERGVYGVQVSVDTADSVVFALKALTSYRLAVAPNPPAGAPHAVIQLANQAWILKRIYLHLSGGLIPGVNAVDLEVQSSDGAPSSYFRLIKNGSSVNEQSISCAPEWTPNC
jgi:hypothetical protein